MAGLKKTGRTWASASAGAIAASLLWAGIAAAQTTTARIQGNAAPGAEITARNIDTGFTSRSTAAADGSYALGGLTPGPYEISVAGAPAEQAQRVSVQVGQVAELDLTAGADDGADVEAVVVTAAPRTLVEVRTSEVATNVSQAQINSLPQNNRNFLNFAALAPGVRLSQDEFRQNFSGGASGAAPEPLSSGQTNVFIDGVSLKSNVQQGGLVGQDSSRGNPFSQLAVQEFRVNTSNFKAEYEQAGTSVITAVTRSGTNDFRAEVFGFYQDDAFIEEDFFVERDNREKPELQRKQYGASLSGPIIRDRLLFFGAYEVNDQVRANQVIAGGTPALRATLPFDVAQFEGSFESPFRENLYFGKLTFRMTDNQTFELSASHRTEDDLRSFGGQTARESGEFIVNEVTTIRAEHDWDTERFLNELTFDYRDSTFEPTSENPNLIGREFQGVIRVGGRDTSQNVGERNFTFRNNITFDEIEANGLHVIKAGAKVSFQEYEVSGANFVNPLFTFINRPADRLDFSFPAEARFGVGNPSVTAENTQFGFFIQDDWEVNDQLILNIGLRYDYETNANNNDYVTPADAAAALRALEATLSTQPGNFFNAEDYISTGDNREPFKGAIQPRIGVSYDFFGDKRTVFFAWAGRFYDRTLFRNAAEESLLRQFSLRTFFFSRDGLPRNGQPTILFRPEYLSREGLNSLIAQQIAPNGELRVVKNDQEPPFTDQFSVGVRQRLGQFNTSATLTHQRGYNEIAYFPANRAVQAQANGANVFIPVPGFGNVVASNDERETRYTALFLQAEKPFTASSTWGATLAVTFSDAEQKGFLFNFDRPNVEEAPFVPNAADEDYRVVATGITRMPYGFIGSFFATFASGSPFFVIDLRPGFERRARLGNFNEGDNFSQVDLRLAKEIELPNNFGRVEFIAEAFNVFDTVNFTGFDGFIPPQGETNANFGRPNAVAPPRSFQFGLRYRY